MCIVRRLAVTLVTALAAATLTSPAMAETTPPPKDGGLNQVIDPNQQQNSDKVVLEEGHIDFGPTLNTGKWRLQIHDDTGIPRYWRMPQNTVLKVNDAAIMPVPQDPAYEFLGQKPGEKVYVVPQTQKNGVVWVGWNTQEPGVIEKVDLGVTMSLVGFQGPGDMIVFLQSGTLGKPEKLYSTRDALPQKTWITTNTHTHANWVFTKPGIYGVQLQFDAKLRDGSTVTTHETLRFAVGSKADTNAAFALGLKDPAPQKAAAGKTEPKPQPASNTSWVWILVLVLAAGVIVAVIVMAVANARMKQRVREARQNRVEQAENENHGGDHA